MRYDFIVLGATGMQGRIVSRDLLENGYSVLLCGRDKKRLHKLINRFKKTGFEYVEMQNIEHVAGVIKKSGANVVICCVEGDWNLNALYASTKANASCIDLGSEIWMTKKQISMHEQLKRKNLISITGCGSVPGVGNVMLNYASKKFDRIHSIDVGFSWTSNIKKFVVPFSIQSIIEEFTEPAPLIINGKWIHKKPLDTIMTMSHRVIGKQEEFFTRHPETWTFYHYFKNMGLKNIRFSAGFPKHSAETIKDLIYLGFDKKTPIKVHGKEVIPIEFLTEILKDLKFPKGYKETENLWVKVRGKKNGKNKAMLMECIVPTLTGWEDAGCNIDTGMPASIIAQMIKRGIINQPGSYSPEAVVPTKPFFAELRKRHMLIYENSRIIN